MQEFQPRPTRERECPSHELTDLPPTLARILAARGVVRDDQRELTLKRLAPLSGLSGVVAAARLMESHRNGRVLVVGDFDADGATSTALVLRCLRDFGFADTDFLVPNRFEFGYGLSPELVEVAKARNPTLIITVDNGISSVAGVAAARAVGIDVVITDHHLPPDALPAANVIVNPNLEGDSYPSKAMAGVGVAFAVMSALSHQLGGDHVRVPARYLDLVALGTVADVVPLDQNNRILVSQGLTRISSRVCCAGIRALLDVAGRDKQTVTASDLGFAVAPRLNAAGRLEDMSVGIRCLLTDDPAEAQQLAETLQAINTERRQIEAVMQEQALEAVAELGDSDVASCLVVYRDSWHQGVVGLVASRLKERLDRPVFAFASESNDRLKGSGRSVPGVHLRDLLAEVDRVNPGMLVKFGGHAMAAGLTLERAQLDAFETALGDAMDALYRDYRFDPVWDTDGALTGELLRLEFAEQLAALGPWGQHFPEPLFESRLRVQERRVVGEHHLKFVFEVDGAAIDGIAFGQVRSPLPELGEEVALVYRLDVNEWRSRKRLQLMIEQWSPVGSC
ncbi:MAG: single-stranded-DNA-specific exonuclease RecJ [Pseudomonadota bacterium]